MGGNSLGRARAQLVGHQLGLVGMGTTSWECIIMARADHIFSTLQVVNIKNNVISMGPKRIFVVLVSSYSVAFHCSVQMAGRISVGFSSSSPGICTERLAVCMGFIPRNCP